MDWLLAPCDTREARALAAELGVSEITARVLLRRGYGDAPTAATFLRGDMPGHDPHLLGAVKDACQLIHKAIAGGTRICVHGDYDVDGICATVLAVLTLRELGADVGWHLPSRFEEGYGLSGQTLEKLADEGYGLVLTVDCGITAVDEVAAARRLGLEVIVTDHHRPGEELPDCPVVATRPSSYPFPELCGTGVVFKLLQALADDPLERHLDLVALATIADVVPLVDENRAFAIAGLRQLARTQRPGLRALMRSARVDPAAVDEGAVAFRLAPRINAAGRLCRPEIALDLLMCEADAEAGELAARLEELNRDRQAVEERIVREATKQIEAWPERRRRQRGYVLADEGWHEGVVGIVASRLVERYRRPVVLIAGTDGEWKGSGRSLSRLRPPRGADRVRGAPRPVRRTSRRRRVVDPARCDRGVLGGVCSARGCPSDGRPAAPDGGRRRRRSRLGAHARAGRGAASARAVRAGQSRRHAAASRL